MQSKRVDEPYSKGDGDVQYNVVYVAPDGVVLDHGQAVATYPVPPGIALQAGDRVVIGRNGELCLPRVPEPGKEKDKGIG